MPGTAVPKDCINLGDDGVGHQTLDLSDGRTGGWSTAMCGSTPTFRFVTVARDQNDNLVTGLKMMYHAGQIWGWLSDSATVRFNQLGRQPLVAEFWGMSDTAWVFVKNQ